MSNQPKEQKGLPLKDYEEALEALETLQRVLSSTDLVVNDEPVKDEEESK